MTLARRALWVLGLVLLGLVLRLRHQHARHTRRYARHH